MSQRRALVAGSVAYFSGLGLFITLYMPWFHGEGVTYDGWTLPRTDVLLTVLAVLAASLAHAYLVVGLRPLAVGVTIVGAVAAGVVGVYLLEGIAVDWGVGAALAAALGITIAGAMAPAIPIDARGADPDTLDLELSTADSDLRLHALPAIAGFLGGIPLCVAVLADGFGWAIPDLVFMPVIAVSMLLVGLAWSWLERDIEPRLRRSARWRYTWILGCALYGWGGIFLLGTGARDEAGAALAAGGAGTLLALATDWTAAAAQSRRWLWTAGLVVSGASLGVLVAISVTAATDFPRDAAVPYAAVAAGALTPPVAQHWPPGRPRLAVPVALALLAAEGFLAGWLGWGPIGADSWKPAAVAGALAGVFGATVVAGNAWRFFKVAIVLAVLPTGCYVASRVLAVPLVIAAIKEGEIPDRQVVHVSLAVAGCLGIVGIPVYLWRRIDGAAFARIADRARWVRGRGHGPASTSVVQESNSAAAAQT